jgi:hypothetical protein
LTYSFIKVFSLNPFYPPGAAVKANLMDIEKKIDGHLPRDNFFCVITTLFFFRLQIILENTSWNIKLNEVTPIDRYEKFVIVNLELP